MASGSAPAGSTSASERSGGVTGDTREFGKLATEGRGEPRTGSLDAPTITVAVAVKGA
jgi:hypothetical protein